MILVGETSKKSDKMPRRLSQKKKPDVNMNNDLHKVTEGAFRNENRCVSHGVGRMNWTMGKSVASEKEMARGTVCQGIENSRTLPWHPSEKKKKHE